MTRQYIDDYFQENHISLQDIIEVSNMDLVIEMAKVSLGVGCVIKDFCQRGITKRYAFRNPLASRSTNGKSVLPITGISKCRIP